MYIWTGGAPGDGHERELPVQSNLSLRQIKLPFSGPRFVLALARIQRFVAQIRVIDKDDLNGPGDGHERELPVGKRARLRLAPHLRVRIPGSHYQDSGPELSYSQCGILESHLRCSRFDRQRRSNFISRYS